MRYRIKTWKADAGISEMTVEVGSLDEASRMAIAQGYAVLDVSPALSAPGQGGSKRFPLLLFAQEMLALLESGISLVEAVETLAEKEQRPGVRSVLMRVVTALREGRPLSWAFESMPEAFPSLFVATVRASERTSNLPEALGRYIAYQTHLEALRGRLVSAAIYPVMLIVVGGLVVLFLMGFVVPRFAHIYEDINRDLPLMSRLMMNWGSLVERHWALLLGVVVAGVILAIRLSRESSVRSWLANRIWRLPFIGERLRLIQLARCYRTLGMLLRGGIPIASALDMVSGLLVPELRIQLVRALASIREGVPMSIAFESNGLTTPVALRMLRVGERAGNMGEMLERSAAFHDEETGRWAEVATRLIGPVLMLVMGVFIGLIVVLMYMPIFQLAESVQ